jgi:hypothetical protein
VGVAGLTPAFAVFKRRRADTVRMPIVADDLRNRRATRITDAVQGERTLSVATEGVRWRLLRNVGYGDEAPSWNELHARYEVAPIEHGQLYSTTAGAYTNGQRAASPRCAAPRSGIITTSPAHT